MQKHYLVFKNDRVYDILKWIAIVVMPLLVTFMAAMTDIWDIPYGTKIVLTMGAVNALVGGIVQKSSSDYHKPDAVKNR